MHWLGLAVLLALQTCSDGVRGDDANPGVVHENAEAADQAAKLLGPAVGWHDSMLCSGSPWGEGTTMFAKMEPYAPHARTHTHTHTHTQLHAVCRKPQGRGDHHVRQDGILRPSCPCTIKLCNEQEGEREKERRREITSVPAVWADQVDNRETGTVGRSILCPGICAVLLLCAPHSFIHKLLCICGNAWPSRPSPHHFWLQQNPVALWCLGLN
jgi:hypothetical protein